MRKSKIDVYELTAKNKYTDSSEENMMEQDNLLEPSNTTINDENEQFFEMELEIDATLKNLATLTIYNWQSADATDSLAFSAASNMWNSIRHANDNGKSSALHHHLLQSKSDSSYIQVDLGLINNIDNETTTLWQTITKVFILITLDANAEVRDNVADANNFIKLRPTQVDAEFFSTLSDDIQPLVRSQQLNFIKHKLSMSIFKFIVKVKAYSLSP